MSIYELQLCKGGQLKSMEWEENNYVEKIIDPEDFVFYINESVCLEKNVTLKDLFRLINSDVEYFSIITSCPVLSEMMEEGLSEEEADNEFCEISFLELQRVCYLEEEDADLKKYLSSHMEFSGVNNEEKYAVELLPLSLLSKFPLFLNEEVSLFYYNNKTQEQETMYNYFQKFTLQELVNGIIEELSFSGPEQKVEIMEKIKNSIDQLDRGEVETFSLEEIKGRLEADIEKFKIPCSVCGQDSRSQHFGKPNNMCYSCFLKGKEN